MFNRTNDRSPTPDIPEEPKRVTPKVFVIILYYTIMHVNDRAVTELIHLKTGEIKFSHSQCRERIEFTEKRFDREAGDWDADEVRREIAQHVDLDTFLKLTEIDRACEKKLGKHTDIPLDNLKNDQNPVKKAAIKAINERAHAKALEAHQDFDSSHWEHTRTGLHHQSMALGAVLTELDNEPNAQEFESTRRAYEAREARAFVPCFQDLSQRNSTSPPKSKGRRSRFREDL